MTTKYRWAVRENTLGLARKNDALGWDHWVAAHAVPQSAKFPRVNLVDFLSMELNVGPVARSLQSALGWPGIGEFAVSYCAPPELPLEADEPNRQSLVPLFRVETEKHPTNSLIDGACLERLNNRWAERLFLLELLNNGGVLRTTVEPVRMDDLPPYLEIVVSRDRSYTLSRQPFRLGAASKRVSGETALELESGRQILGLHERSAAELEEVLFTKLRSDWDTATLHARAKQKFQAERTLRDSLRKRIAQNLRIFVESLEDKRELASFLRWLENTDVNAVPPPLVDMEYSIITRTCKRSSWQNLRCQYKQLGADFTTILREMAHSAASRTRPGTSP